MFQVRASGFPLEFSAYKGGAFLFLCRSQHHHHHHITEDPNRHHHHHRRHGALHHHHEQHPAEGGAKESAGESKRRSSFTPTSPEASAAFCTFNLSPTTKDFNFAQLSSSSPTNQDPFKPEKWVPLSGAQGYEEGPTCASLSGKAASGQDSSRSLDPAKAVLLATRKSQLKLAGKHQRKRKERRDSSEEQDKKIRARSVGSSTLTQVTTTIL